MNPKDKQTLKGKFISSRSPKRQIKPRGSVWAKWMAANASALGLSSTEAKQQLLEKPFHQVVAERGLSRVKVLADISSQLVGFFQSSANAAGRLAVSVVNSVHISKNIDAIAAKQARRAP